MSTISDKARECHLKLTCYDFISDPIKSIWLLPYLLLELNFVNQVKIKLGSYKSCMTKTHPWHLQHKNGGRRVNGYPYFHKTCLFNFWYFVAAKNIHQHMYFYLRIDFKCIKYRVHALNILYNVEFGNTFQVTMKCWRKMPMQDWRLNVQRRCWEVSVAPQVNVRESSCYTFSSRMGTGFKQNLYEKVARTQPEKHQWGCLWIFIFN